MTAIPDFITFTGADERTDSAGMLALSKQYPIEWGILFSPKRQGIQPRYPALAWVEQTVKALPLRFAAHLCGDDARDVIEASEGRHDKLLCDYFERSQINTANSKVQPSLIGAWARKLNVRAILQCRSYFPRVNAVDVLYDASGGRGILPGAWPEAACTTFCGYAGGLRPENVADAVHDIGEKASHYWIDMETGVRDEDDRFSLEKCRAVCEAVYGKAAA